MNDYVMDFLTKTIEQFKNDAPGDFITRWLPLGYDDSNNLLGIVCGWSEGFDEEETQLWNVRGSRRIYMKFAIIPNNSIMREYDIDWLMPYDEETGETDDTEIPISNNMYDINWLLEAYKRYIDTNKSILNGECK